MKTIRRMILGLSAFMAAWVILSFVGVMFNTGNAGLWTTSLMWSLLASVLVMPGLVVAHHATNRAERKAAQKRMAEASAREKQPAFIEEDYTEDTFWPPAETESADRG